jgi:hypothetical protein
VYNQVVGAWIKITMQFHLPKQGWRQLKVFSTPVLKRTASYSTSFALFTQTVAVLTFVYGVGVIVFQRNSILHHAIVW